MSMMAVPPIGRSVMDTALGALPPSPRPLPVDPVAAARAAASDPDVQQVADRVVRAGKVYYLNHMFCKLMISGLGLGLSGLTVFLTQYFSNKDNILEQVLATFGGELGFKDNMLQQDSGALRDDLRARCYTKSEVDNLLNNKLADTYSQSQVNALLIDKADTSTVYDIDSKLVLKADLNDVYTKSQSYSSLEIDGKLVDKIDTSDAYDKDLLDAMLRLKANVAGTYTQSHVDILLNAKASVVDVDGIASQLLSKADSSNIHTTSQSYSSTEVDLMFSEMSTVLQSKVDHRLLQGTIAYFNSVDGCPDGWVEESRANGRVVVGISNADASLWSGGSHGFPIAVGDDLRHPLPSHSHVVKQHQCESAGAHTHDFQGWMWNEGFKTMGFGNEHGRLTRQTSEAGAHEHNIPQMDTDDTGETGDLTLPYVHFVVCRFSGP